jgi:type I restriction enzyme S subunit
VVRDARIPVPSIEEQKRVVGEFAELAIQHENLAASANEVKSLLAERRQALISAAVTGKINVGGAST